jgi:acetolactate synthase-1/2/3 large subunit
MPRLTGSEIAVRLLERQGVDVVAGIPGGAVLPLYDALGQSARLRHVLARHEQGAGFIAQGIARTTGRPAVCIASSGPGATNLLTAIADAKLDSIPLVAITGQVPRALIGTDAFQEVDTLGLAAPITKHSFFVSSAAQLCEVIPAAFRIAASGRPGPVLVDIPKDVQTETADVDEWPAPGEREPAAAPDDAALERAAAMIDAAAAPVLYLGGGIVHAGAASAARALAARSSLPTVTTLMALGTLPAEHPLALGMLGMHGAPYTNLALDECDLLIAVGARFDDRATGKLARFCPRASVIHVDVDAAELGKLRKPELAIRADARLFLEHLLPNLAARRRRAWNARMRALRNAHPLAMPGRDSLRKPYGLIDAVATAARAASSTRSGPEAASPPTQRTRATELIVTTDVGQHQMWIAQAFPFARPRELLTSGGLGTMGFGLPAAIGAALAAPEATVLCVSGDGSILMNVQELATLAEENLNVKILLVDNRSLGLVFQQQTLFYERRTFASAYRRPMDFVALARAFGIPAFDLDTAGAPRSELAAAFARYGPCLIHASVATAEQVLPMVPPGAANVEMIRALDSLERPDEATAAPLSAREGRA